MNKTLTENGVRITSDKPCWILICDSEFYYREPFNFIGGFCDIGGNAEVFETEQEAEAHKSNLTFKVIEIEE